MAIRLSTAFITYLYVRLKNSNSFSGNELNFNFGQYPSVVVTLEY